MAIYRVYVEQVSYNTIKVEAETLEEAFEKAESDWADDAAFVEAPIAKSAEKRYIHDGHEVWR